MLTALMTDASRFSSRPWTQPATRRLPAPREPRSVLLGKPKRELTARSFRLIAVALSLSDLKLVAAGALRLSACLPGAARSVPDDVQASCAAAYRARWSAVAVSRAGGCGRLATQRSKWLRNEKAGATRTASQAAPAAAAASSPPPGRNLGRPQGAA